MADPNTSTIDMSADAGGGGYFSKMLSPFQSFYRTLERNEYSMWNAAKFPFGGEGNIDGENYGNDKSPLFAASIGSPLQRPQMNDYFSKVFGIDTAFTPDSLEIARKSLLHPDDVMHPDDASHPVTGALGSTMPPSSTAIQSGIGAASNAAQRATAGRNNLQQAHDTIMDLFRNPSQRGLMEREGAYGQRIRTIDMTPLERGSMDINAPVNNPNPYDKPLTGGGKPSDIYLNPMSTSPSYA